MSDTFSAGATAPSSTAPSALLDRVARLGDELGGFDGRGLTDDELLTLVTELEELKCRAEAGQVLATAAFDASQRATQAAAGVPQRAQGQGVALQMALARRESHHRGQQHLGLARVLTRELPFTLDALRAGLISEWRATLVARETACLSREHRAEVDRALGHDPHAWSRRGERELIGELRRLAYRLDPAAVVARRRRAESERSVSLRPAPDCMTYLTALLPVATGVAVHAELTRTANSARAAGDERSRGQVMADTLATRSLGQQDAQAPRIPVTVNVVVSDEVLLGVTTRDNTEALDDTAYVEGYGPVPGALARQLATSSVDVEGEAAVHLRRLYAAPDSGALVALESRSRCFPRALADYVRLRDRTCRTPWCDAPARHVDHVRAHTAGGPTTAQNAQGLCEACNLAKAAPGWVATTTTSDGGGGHTVMTMTPTGRTYGSTAPPLPRPLPRHRPGRGRVHRSWSEWTLEVLLQQHAA